MKQIRNTHYPEFMWPTEAKRMEDLRTRVEKVKERYKEEVWTGFFTILFKKTGVNRVKLSHFYNRVSGLMYEDFYEVERTISKMEKTKNFLN